ncbi:MAG: hypothetical protein IPI65_10450 [Bacteroidetes bacterium]|nr:hypothetical protein [Bacteroidota bacterium]
MQLILNYPRFKFFVSPLPRPAGKPTGFCGFLGEVFVTILSPLPYQEGKAMRLIFFNNYISTIVSQSSKIQFFVCHPYGVQLILGEAVVTILSPRCGWFFFIKAFMQLILNYPRVKFFVSPLPHPAGKPTGFN